MHVYTSHCVHQDHEKETIWLIKTNEAAARALAHSVDLSSTANILCCAVAPVLVPGLLQCFACCEKWDEPRPVPASCKTK